MCKMLISISSFNLICEFTHVMLKVCVKLAALSTERPGRRKTYGPGMIRTHDHAFRGHLLYYWATSQVDSGLWTSRLSCHLVELEVSSCLIHYCQLQVIQLVSLVCWRSKSQYASIYDCSTIFIIYNLSWPSYHEKPLIWFYLRSCYLAHEEKCISHLQL